MYYPLRRRYDNRSVALLLTMLTTGAWHSLSPGWLLWGLHHGTGLLLLAKYHRATRDSVLLNAWRQTLWFRIASIGAVWLFVTVGHGLTLAAGNVSHSIQIYLHLLGVGYLL